MRAKTIGFERGGDPYEKLQIGKHHDWDITLDTILKNVLKYIKDGLIHFAAVEIYNNVYSDNWSKFMGRLKNQISAQDYHDIDNRLANMF